jgi:hypothetical protein
VYKRSFQTGKELPAASTQIPQAPGERTMNQSLTLRFPDFIGIGAQKAGTTWLHRMLERHPEIWMPPVKELHYFDRAHAVHRSHLQSGPTPLDEARMEGVLRLIERVLKSRDTVSEKLEKVQCLSVIGNAQLTDEWYGRIFQAAPKSALCGEITPEYALLPEQGVEHVLRLQPRIKMIYMMRDPIDRTWSALCMIERKGKRGPDALLRRMARKSFMAYSDYAATIKRVRRHVAHTDFLQLFYDDLVARPEHLLREVLGFLGVDPERASFRKVAEPIHAGQKKPIEPDLYNAIRDRMEPIYHRLLALNNPVIDGWYRRHYGTSSP